MKLVADQKLREIAEPCLRQKADFNDYESDLKLFQSYPLGDTWPDANLASVFFYLYKNKKMEVPSEWKETMSSFYSELKSATCLNMFVGSSLKETKTNALIPSFFNLIPILHGGILNGCWGNVGRP